MKFKFYTGQDLKKEWVFSRKLDGVHVVIYDGEAFSKAGNRLHNLEWAAYILDDGRYELFDTDWATSISACKNRSKGQSQIKVGNLYSLEPLDPRLWCGTFVDPSEQTVREALDRQLANGDEGLIITRGNRKYKLKDEVTVDILVTGVIEGTGKCSGCVGSLVTGHGKIGTGFSREVGAELWNDPNTVGSIVEAKCQGFTPAGKMRHARYIRSRWDKNTENLEGGYNA